METIRVNRLFMERRTFKQIERSNMGVLKARVKKKIRKEKIRQSFRQGRATKTKFRKNKKGSYKYINAKWYREAKEVLMIPNYRCSTCTNFGNLLCNWEMINDKVRVTLR